MAKKQNIKQKQCYYKFNKDFKKKKVSVLTFICLMHSEAKQTETLALGAEKGLLQSHEADR